VLGAERDGEGRRCRAEQQRHQSFLQHAKNRKVVSEHQSYRVKALQRLPLRMYNGKFF
jgi:hypothetical protein